MADIGIGVGVTAALLGASWGTYFLYHNDYDVLLLTPIGRLWAMILFPGEDDMHMLFHALQYKPGLDLTGRKPCAICARDVKSVGSEDFHSSACDRLQANKYPPIGFSRWLDKKQCQRDKEHAERGDDASSIRYEIDAATCVAVNGMYGFPDRRFGLSARDYIIKRLFPSNSGGLPQSKNYNRVLFTQGTPYQGDADASVGGLEGSALQIWYRLAADTIMTKDANKPFLPPLLEESINWIQVGPNDYMPEHQMIGSYRNGKFVRITGQHLNPVWGLGLPGNPDFQEQLQHSYHFGAYIRYIAEDGKVYYSFEWAPVGGSGSKKEWRPVPFSKWSEPICQDYIKQFLTTATLQPNAELHGKPKSKRIFGRGGFAL